MPIGRSPIHMNRENVRRREQPLPAHRLSPRAQLFGNLHKIVIDHSTRQHSAHLGDGLTNAPQAEYPQGRFTQLARRDEFIAPPPPLIFCDGALDANRRAKHIEDHRKNIFNHRRRVRLRRVDHCDPTSFARIKIDVVHSHSSPPHHAQSRRPFKHRCINARVRPHNDRVSLRKRSIQGRWISIFNMGEVTSLTEPCEGVSIERLGDEDSGARHHAKSSSSPLGSAGSSTALIEPAHDAMSTSLPNA